MYDKRHNRSSNQHNQHNHLPTHLVLVDFLRHHLLDGAPGNGTASATDGSRPHAGRGSGGACAPARPGACRARR